MAERSIETLFTSCPHQLVYYLGGLGGTNCVLRGTVFSIHPTIAPLMADTWDNIHSVVLLAGMFLVVHFYPRSSPIIHLVAWLAAWTFGYYFFATKLVPRPYRPPSAR